MQKFILTFLVCTSFLIASQTSTHASDRIDFIYSERVDFYQNDQLTFSPQAELDINLEEGWSLHLNEMERTSSEIRDLHRDNSSFALDEDEIGVRLGLSLRYRFE